MSWIAHVWGGPFKTPPVQYPITVGWVLLKVLETIWRLFLLVIVAIALIFGFIWQSERNPLSSQVKIELSRSVEYCQKRGWPIGAHITNNSSKTIGDLGLKFRVYTYGRSDDLAAYGTGAYQELHNIIRPGQALDWCFPMPQISAMGPYTVAGDVTYASELSKDVPDVARSVTPPPLVRMEASRNSYSRPRSPAWVRAGITIAAIMAFGLFLSGGYGVIALVDRIFKTRLNEKVLSDPNNKGGCLVAMVVSFLNAIIVGTGGGYLLDALGWGAWLTDVTNWGRANGAGEDGLLLVSAIFCQWPWIIWLMLAKVGRTASD